MDDRVKVVLDGLLEDCSAMSRTLSDIGELDYSSDSKYIALVSKFSKDFSKVYTIISGVIENMEFLNNSMNDLNRISTSMNFLSLNAAIESAEAKEKSGKGFEGVAHQIGDLSKELSSITEGFSSCGESMMENVKIAKGVVHGFKDLLEDMEESLSYNDKLYSQFNNKMGMLFDEIKAIEEAILFLEESFVNNKG